MKDDAAVAAEPREGTDEVLHDVSNLLMSLVATVSMAKHQAHYSPGLKGSLDSVENGLFVVSRLLDRLRTDPSVPCTAGVDVIEELRRHEKFWAGCAGEHVHFSMTLPRGSVRVPLRRTDLYRILVNLIGNAAEATPPGGRIVLQCGVDQTAHWVELRDTGRGMTEEQLAAAYIDGYTGAGSSGLGLGTVRALVMRAGGELSISSKPRGGTLVRIEFAATGGMGT